MNKIIITFSLIIFFSCSHKTFTLTDGDVKRGNEKFPATTLASLNDGKMLYENNCGTCHALKNAASNSEEKWRDIVPKMVVKVNKKAGREELDSKKQELILHYLVTMCNAPSK